MKDEEETVARLLRLGGARPSAPPDREKRVKAAVMREARLVSSARRRRRATAGAAILLATAAVVAVAVRLAAPPDTSVPVSPVVAVVERMSGDDVRMGRAGAASARAVATGDTLRVGDELTTGVSSRLGVRVGGDTSLRLDRATHVRFAADAAVALVSGAIYVDRGPEDPPLNVETALGIVRDIGTQFEVRVEAQSLRVRVRSGIVELRRGPDVTPARVGTEIAVSATGLATRPVPAFGVAWEWVAEVAPAFSAEGRPLGEFLEHLCREQGWTLTYADGGLGADAARIVVHGSVAGLAPLDGLAAVLSTSGLAYRLEGGALVVFRPGER